MDDRELLRLLYKKLGARQIAGALDISESMLHKWSQDGAGHRKNPLEDFLTFAIAVNWDADLMHWLCALAGGYYVHNPEAPNGKPMPLNRAHYKVLHDLAQTLALITREAEHNSICKDAPKIRKNWDGLKSVVEGFVVACEKVNPESLRTAIGAPTAKTNPTPPPKKNPPGQRPQA